MYSAGDEIGAVVGDVGSVCCKIGFAGEDFPRAYFSSAVGLTVDADGSEAAGAKAGPAAAAGGASPGGKGAGGAAAGAGGDAMDTDREAKAYKCHVDAQWERTDMELRWPIGRAGAVTDWDLVEKLWQHAASTKLSVDLSTTPVLLCEKSSATAATRAQYAELMFERFSAPALFLGRDAVLSCFAMGKTTGTAVDVGGHTTVTPVTDGWVDPRAVVTSPLGTFAMHRYCALLMEAHGSLLKPTQAFRTGCKPRHYTSESTWHPSYREFVQLEVARDIMEAAGRASDVPVDDQAPQFTSVPGVPYKLPDGTDVVIGVERFKVPELLFNTDPLTNAEPGTPLAALAETLQGEPDTRLAPLQQLLSECFSRCDRENQNQLMSTIVVCGGGSGFEGVPERLRAEIELAAGPGVICRTKVLAAGPSERRVSAWLGGSILGSLGSFHEMWMSRQEYEEHGARLINKKCP